MEMSSSSLIFSHGVWMRPLNIRAHFKAPDVGAIFLHNPISIYTGIGRTFVLRELAADYLTHISNRSFQT